VNGSKRRGQRRFDEPPRPPIAAVLKELGAESVPTGFGWVKMRCFAHEDRTPSAAVNHELDGFTCHSCGRSGDALKLLQSELGLTFREACDRASNLDPDSGNRQAKKTKRTRRASDLL
jgi:DNA primase